MPEGDTIFRTAAALHRALAGHTVTRFETALAHIARVNDDTPIVGRIVDGCESVGKHVLMRFSGDLVLRTHMRMSGSWHLYRPGERWQRSPRDMRVRIDTATWVAVAFDVPVVEFVAGSEVARDPALSKLGPDLLSADLDRGLAAARIAAAGSRPIDEVLLDQKVIAGIGNVFKSEVLFVAGVHPDMPVDRLDAAACARIVDIAVRLMRANVGAVTSSAIVTYRTLRTVTRRAAPSDNLWVYGRAGKPCRTCGTPIRSVKRPPESRTTYWCEKCQGGPR